MAEQEKIKLTQLLEACLNFTKEPSSVNERKVIEITKLFSYREYIPLVEKQVIVARIVGGIPGDEYDALVCENWLILSKVIYGVLSYVVNLENDLDRVAMTPSVVDLLYKLGIIDDILEHCKKDYERLEGMVNDVVNFSNIFRLVQTAELFDPKKLEDFVKELKELQKDLTPEMLADMKKLAVAGSPEFAILKEAVADEAIGKTMEGEFNAATAIPEEKKEEEPAEEKAEA